MPLQIVGLGTEINDGADGESHRQAWEKGNANFEILNGAVPYVAGGLGFVNVSGAVTIDLNAGRSFHHTMTGNITSLAFSNIPSGDVYSATWTWVLAVNATGGYLLQNPPTVTWVDGADFDSLDLSANAINIVTFWRVGTVTYAALVTNGALSLDPYVLSFPSDGTQLVAITQDQTLDFGSITNLEADGTAGTGTVTFKRNGGADITGTQAFTAGQVLTVTMTGSTTASSVSIPRLL